MLSYQPQSSCPACGELVDFSWSTDPKRSKGWFAGATFRCCPACRRVIPTKVPKRGDRFIHARLLDPETNQKDVVCTVTAVRYGAVYYTTPGEGKAHAYFKLEAMERSVLSWLD